MWSIVATTLLMVGLTSALPLLPPMNVKEMSGGKLSADESLRTFIVQVQEGQRRGREEMVREEQAQQQQQQMREFPWPYPPVFESILPVKAKQRLVQLYYDQSLTSEDRAQQVNAVFDQLPHEVIEQLPLPVEYERLPADVYKRLLYIHVAPGFKWAERQQLIRDIVESLPDAQKQLMRTPRIGGPPSGFEQVLAPSVYKQLLLVHHNNQMTKEQKSELITRIMRQVPQDQINQLPLPVGMQELPAELRAKARALVFDYTVPQTIRALRVREFVQALPAELRPQLR